MNSSVKVLERGGYPVKKSDRQTTSKDRKPINRGMTPEARENRLIALAYDVAEEQMRNGTASAQVISHFLKLGSTSGRLEQDILSEQKKLVKAKTENLESAKRTEESYKNALDAMKLYGGYHTNDEVPPDE